MFSEFPCFVKYLARQGSKQNLKDSDAERQALAPVTGFSPQQPLPPAAL